MSFNYNWEDYKPGIFGHRDLSYIDGSGSFRCLIPRDKPRTKLSLFVDNFQNQIGHIFFFPELQLSRSPSHFTRIFFIFSRAIMAQGSQAAHGILCIPINFSFLYIRIPNLQFISVCVFSRVRSFYPTYSPNFPSCPALQSPPSMHHICIPSCIFKEGVWAWYSFFQVLPEKLMDSETHCPECERAQRSYPTAGKRQTELGKAKRKREETDTKPFSQEKEGFFHC